MAVASKAVVAGAVLLACAALVSLRTKTDLGFVVASPSATTAQSPQALATRPMEAIGTARVAGQTCGRAFGVVGVVAAAAALAGLVRRRRSVRVAMGIRPHRKYRMSKGMKPVIHRPIATDMMKDAKPLLKKRYDGKIQSEFEDIVKKNLFGNVKFMWSSKQFTDDIPWFGFDGGIKNRSEPFDHHPGNPLYMRKFITTGKFKKLELAQWEMPENFAASVTMKELVDAGVQYGHSSAAWNPLMLKYLYADNDGTHIFDLVQTAAWLNRACYYVMEAASKGANFLFVGTKEQARGIIKEHATRCGQPYCDERFVGGLLTNMPMTQEGIALMKKLVQERDQGAWSSDSQDEREKKENSCNRLIRKYSGVAELDDLPDVMIVVDEFKERHPVNESQKCGIPVVGLIDSNNNPSLIDVPIPGNASGAKSIDLVIGKLTEAILRGQAMLQATPAGDRETIPNAWDPWLFSRDRMRNLRRRSKRQPWMKAEYGSYENYKKAYPYGHIKPVIPYKKFTWSVRPQRQSSRK